MEPRPSLKGFEKSTNIIQKETWTPPKIGPGHPPPPLLGCLGNFFRLGPPHTPQDSPPDTPRFPLGVVLEPSCIHLGAVVGRLGAVLEPSWGGLAAPRSLQDGPRSLQNDPEGLKKLQESSTCFFHHFFPLLSSSPKALRYCKNQHFELLRHGQLPDASWGILAIFWS